MTKDSSETVVSQITTHALHGAEASVNFTASVTSSNGEAIPACEAVTIHVGSAARGAVTNGSGIATCSITNSALGSGSYPVSATYAGDAFIAGSTSTNALSFTVWAKPTFTSANSTSAAVGHSFSFSVTATGHPTAMWYSISGSLPSGVSFNSSTGVLSGTPRSGTTGTYNVTITATKFGRLHLPKSPTEDCGTLRGSKGTEPWGYFEGRAPRFCISLGTVPRRLSVSSPTLDTIDGLMRQLTV